MTEDVQPNDQSQDIKEPAKFDGQVRFAKMEDLPHLRRILEMWVRWQGEVIPEEVEADLEEVKASISAPQDEATRRYFVAVDSSGRAIGMMGLALETKPEILAHSTTPQPMELVNAYVHKDFIRGKGGKNVGSALADNVENLARSLGATAIMLDSGPRYKDSGHGFYDQRGYQKVAENKDFYGPDGTAVVWQHPL